MKVKLKMIGVGLLVWGILFFLIFLLLLVIVFMIVLVEVKVFN